MERRDLAAARRGRDGGALDAATRAELAAAGADSRPNGPIARRLRRRASLSRQWRGNSSDAPRGRWDSRGRMRGRGAGGAGAESAGGSTRWERGV